MRVSWSVPIGTRAARRRYRREDSPAYDRHVPDVQVTLEATGQRFTASTDQPLLTAALQAGVAIASSCRVGTCRTCMRRLVSGAVTYRIDWPSLTPEEKAEGWVLPCVAYPAGDLVLGGDALKPWWEADGTEPAD
jgi:ferredoxin